MPNFAIVKNGIVTRVERIESAEMLDGEGTESEAIGQAFLNGLYPDIPADAFILTHYPSGVADPYPRGKYAGIGDTWDGAIFSAPIEETP
jgi:hypothetical protein